MLKQWKANLELLPCHDFSSQVRELCFHLPLSLEISKYKTKYFLSKMAVRYQILPTFMASLYFCR